MSFLDKMQKTMNETMNVSITENGAVGYRTTGKELLDINFKVSSFRNMADEAIIEDFVKAFYENKMLAVKWLFYASDVRGGIGERRLFRVCMNYLAMNHTEIARAVLELIPEYSRWDNLICLIDTKLKQDVVAIIERQMREDVSNCIAQKPISLLAKWLPSENASSAKTKKLANEIIAELKMTPKQYRKMLSKLRAYLNVVEVSMSAKEWSEINYSAVPSRANLIYNSAFLRNDEERRRAYLTSLEKGETKINAGVLFPHDIVHKYIEKWRNGKDTTLEELWKNLPDLVKGNGSTICVSDGSGSMTHRVGNTNVSALDVANALSIYFAERCNGEFKDKYITFSTRPRLVDLSNGNNLREKIEIARKYNEVADTNIEAVFDLILATAIDNKMTQEEIPQNILILSDMEFNSCVTCDGGTSWNRRYPTKTLFKEIAKKYEACGYKLPRLIFWNIISRTGTIPVKENDLGVALVSGFSPNIMKMVMSNSTDPFECLLEQINAERYKPVEDAIKELVVQK